MTTTKVVAEDRDSTEIPVAKVVKDRASVGIVVAITHLGNALPMEKNGSDARSPTTSRSSAEVTHRTGHRVKEVVVGKHIKTCMKLKRKIIHLQCMNMMLLMSKLCVSLPMSSTLIMQTLHLMRFPVIGNYLLTDVTVSNKIGNKTTVHVKLDTGASGNLLPYNVFKEIFPHVSVKELHHSIDDNVCSEAHNKSSIKQLGTCHSTVRAWYTVIFMSFLCSTRMLLPNLRFE